MLIYSKQKLTSEDHIWGQNANWNLLFFPPTNYTMGWRQVLHNNFVFCGNIRMDWSMNLHEVLVCQLGDDNCKDIRAFDSEGMSTMYIKDWYNHFKGSQTSLEYNLLYWAAPWSAKSRNSCEILSVMDGRL